jgi:ABC-type antimicrobial peptide transport system permease subunit
MALGGDQSTVVRMILRGALYRVLIGIAIGVPLAMEAGRLLSAELYGVSALDSRALCLAACALTVCTMIAAAIPATRAASISPMRALRTE